MGTHVWKSNIPGNNATMDKTHRHHHRQGEAVIKLWKKQIGEKK